MNAASLAAAFRPLLPQIITQKYLGMLWNQNKRCAWRETNISIATHILATDYRNKAKKKALHTPWATS